MNYKKTRDIYRRIFIADVDCLKKAREKYGDSWIKRGGVGAFMMLARKWDRIENTIKSGNFTNYLDALAADPSPTGLIDDIRDLRRYLRLLYAYTAYSRPPYNESSDYISCLELSTLGVGLMDGEAVLDINPTPNIVVVSTEKQEYGFTINEVTAAWNNLESKVKLHNWDIVAADAADWNMIKELYERVDYNPSMIFSNPDRIVYMVEQLLKFLMRVEQSAIANNIIKPQIAGELGGEKYETCIQTI